MEMLNEKSAYEAKLNEYVSDEKAAVSLISSIGHLMYEKSIELVLFRNPLVDQSISQVLNLHKKAKTIAYNPVDVQETSALAKAIESMDIAPSKIDIGRLASEWETEKKQFRIYDRFFKQ